MNTSTVKQNPYDCFETKLGWGTLCSSERGIQRITFGFRTSSAARSSLHSWAKMFDIHLVHDSMKHDDLVNRLIHFANGEPESFLDVEIDFPKLTPFQLAVTNACRSIPYGQTRSYGEVAAVCGSPRASRAVGNVMRNNPVPLLVPCHRVVGSNGKLGGFSAPQGTKLKKRLLDLEAVHMSDSFR